MREIRRLTPFEAIARAHARRERAEQGLPPKVENPEVYRRLAMLLR
jgi:hypothetical protein